MIARLEVQLGEEFGAKEFVQHLLNDRYEKLVFDGALIESPIVHAEMP
jgi:hypothetical protein